MRKTYFKVYRIIGYLLLIFLKLWVFFYFDILASLSGVLADRKPLFEKRFQTGM